MRNVRLLGLRFPPIVHKYSNTLCGRIPGRNRDILTNWLTFSVRVWEESRYTVESGVLTGAPVLLVSQRATNGVS